MATVDFNSPVVFLRRAGNSSDPFISISQTMKIQNSQVLLQEIPDTFHKVTVTGTTNPVYEQNGGIPTPTTYVVDYTQGFVYFDSSLNGQTATFQFYGTGVAYVNIARIMTANDGTTVTQTLQDLASNASTQASYAQSAGNSLGYQGVYNASTAYTRNNIVSYQGVTYICTSNTTTGTDPTHTANWSKITSWRWQGTYSSTATYNFGDYVVDSNNTNIYLCTQDGITNIPLTDTTKWVLILSVASAISAANSATSNANSAANSANQSIANLGGKGTWSSTTAYQPNNIVNYNNKTYMCTVANTNIAPDSDVTKWTLLIDVSAAITNANNAASSANTSATNAQNVANNTKSLGAWSSSTAYQPNNVVTYNGTSYMCTVANTNVLPTDTAYWNIIASKGDQGIQGLTGQGYNWRGAYNAATAYNPYDSVGYNGSSYVCTVATTGNTPTDTNHWNVLAQSGSVTQVSSANGDISVANPTSQPQLTLNSTTTGQSSGIQKLDTSGNSNAMGFNVLPSGTATSSQNYSSGKQQFERSFWNGTAAVLGISAWQVYADGSLHWLNESGSSIWSLAQSGKLQSKNNTLDDSIGNFGLGITPTYGFHQLGGAARIQGLSTPSPTVTVSGTAGTTSYTYYVVARDRNGNRTLVSSAVTTTTGNATLSTSNYNIISWSAVAGAVSYDVLKTNTSTLLVNTTSTSLNDTGQGTSSYTPPTHNETADFTADGNGSFSALQSGGKNVATIDSNNNVIQPANTSLNMRISGTDFAPSQSATNSTVAVRDANGNVITSLPTANSQNPNLVFNPSARLGLAGWSNVNSSPWSANTGSYGEGGYFSITTASAIANYGLLDSQHIPATVGATFTMSAEVLTQGQTAGSASIEIHAFNSSGTQIGFLASSPATNGSSAWQKLTISYTTPTNTAYVIARLVYAQGSISTNTAYRKIKLEGGSIATTFSDDNTLNTQQYGNVLPFLQIVSGGYKQEVVQSQSATTPATTGNDQKINTFTFPTAFTSGSTPMVIPVLNSGSSAVGSLSIKNVTATTFDLYGNISTASAAITFSYLAIGS